VCFGLRCATDPGFVNLKTSGNGNGNNNPGSQPIETTELLDTLVFAEEDTASKKIIGDFNVYPNPSVGKFNIDVPSDKEILIVVIDLLGIEHYSKVYTPETDIDKYTIAIDPYNKLKPGVYMVIASSDDGLYRKKIVVQ